MKYSIILIALIAFSNFGFSQKTDKKTKVNTASEQKQEPRKIVIQLASADSSVHKMLMKQLNNILTVAPDSKIEVVCHGPGLNILVSETTIVHKQMEDPALKGVDFVACRFSMKDRKVKEEQLIKQARIVEAGIIEIVDKQIAGWAYIKAGI